MLSTVKTSSAHVVQVTRFAQMDQLLPPLVFLLRVRSEATSLPAPIRPLCTGRCDDGELVELIDLNRDRLPDTQDRLTAESGAFSAKDVPGGAECGGQAAI
jgi:hypothetical protein